MRKRITEDEMTKLEDYLALLLDVVPRAGEPTLELARGLERYVAEVRRLRILLITGEDRYQSEELAAEVRAIREELEALSVRGGGSARG